jgi:hypothetical protein
MRYPDWQAQLLNCIQAAQGRPFVWGTLDCCLFVADCCVALCGIDPAASYRGRYCTETEAKRVLLREHGSIGAVLDAHFKQVPVMMAQRGDAVVYDGPNGETAGVIWAGAIWAVTEQGAQPLPGVRPKAVWRVE